MSRRAGTARAGGHASLAALVAGLALSAALLGGAAWSVLSTATGEAPTVASERSVAERKASEAASEPTYDVPFAEAMVQDRTVWDYEGVRTRDVTVLNPSADADYEATARACVEAEGGGVEAVNCYVFASTRAYRFKNMYEDLSANPQVGTQIPITNMCWIARGAVEGGSRKVVYADMRDAPELWRSQQCPASWTGPSGGGA